MNEYKGIMPTKIELTLEQSQQGVSNDVLVIWWWRYPIPAESNSLPHAHAQTTKTYYKHQDSRIKKAQVLKTKTSAYSDIKDNSSETKLQGRLLESFQEDAKYKHVGQDTRSQETGGSAQISALRMRRGGVSMRDACLRKTGGTEDVSYESGRFGVYWDPVDGEAMLGVMWPLRITPEDCRIHAERPKPVVLQEELLSQEQYQRRMIAQRISQQHEQEPIKQELVHQEHLCLEPLQEEERELNEYFAI
ncbi:hypothetical protein Tco_0370792 [Tanacetum coccineum]